MRSMKFWKRSFLERDMAVGIPRYLACLSTCLTPRIFFNAIQALVDTLELKEISDLSKLIFWPDAFSYKDKMSPTVVISALDSLPKIILSFAKKIIVRLIELFDRFYNHGCDSEFQLSGSNQIMLLHKTRTNKGKGDPLVLNP